MVSQLIADKPIRVLLVEDDPGYRRLLGIRLADAASAGLEMIEAERLSTGLERLKDGDLDVILLDLTLPDSVGIDTLIKMKGEAQNVPIVVLTGVDDEEIAKQAVHEGAQDYIVKGDEKPHILLRSLQYAIDRHDLILELKNRNLALMASEERFRSLISQNADGILVVNSDGKIQFLNPAAQELFQRDAEELVGEVFDWFPVLSDGVAEPNIISINGGQVIAEVRVVETEWEGETANLASLRDITARVQAEEEILTEKRRTEAIIEHMADGLIMIDKDVNLLSINPAGRRMLGIGSLDVIGTRIDQQGSPSSLRALIRKTGSLKTTSIDHDGTGITQHVINLDPPLSHTLEVFSSWVKDSNNQLLGKVLVLHDITRERELVQAKDNFISTVSHELRTPVFSIQGFLELILNDKVPDPKKRKRFLELSYEQCKHLRFLLDELLDISRIESGKLIIQKEEISIAGVINRVVEYLQTRAIEKGLDLHANVPPNLPLIEGDGERLEQVISNLVDNAIKFTPEGGKITIIGNVDEKDLLVQVIDTGIGIPADEVSELFQMFYQVDSSSSREIGGTGLGLYISKQLIEMHGGQIWVESVPGRGSNFSFTIPLSETTK